MTLDGLLAIAGILLAIIAIADPVQRRSILMFCPRVLLIAALCAAILAVMFLRAAVLWAIPISRWTQFSLYVLSFLVPALAAVACVICWHRARLNKKNAQSFASVVDGALKEGKYDEAERIIRRNHDQLTTLTDSSLHRIFDRKIVRTLLDARSYLHVELITSEAILNRKDLSRFHFVDNVVRELVMSPNSPWRSVVLWDDGAQDFRIPLDEERKVVKATLQNPKWYAKASVHMALSELAIETVQSGRFDIDYNQIAPAYESRSGMSTRAHCPVFLAVKMEVLALKAVVLARNEDGPHDTGLWNVFRVIRDHSKYDQAIWRNSLANHEHPTPYAYLLHEIFYDLRSILFDALGAAVPRTERLTEEEIAALAQAAAADASGEDSETPAKKDVTIAEPLPVDRRLALVWSFCAWGMAHAERKVGRSFRISMIREYLDLVLALHCQPSAIPTFAGLGSPLTGLEAWRDIFLGEIKQRFAGDYGNPRESLARAFSGIEAIQPGMQEGKDWLGEQLEISEPAP